MVGDDFKPGEVVAGRYRIVRLIGQGGMGAVYEAEQLTLRRDVALKVLFDDDDTALARFEQEALALGRIRHPNVVGVIDFHREEGGRACLVMELLRGESLLERIKRDEQLDLRAAVDISAAVLAGLDAIHQRGIVHRDLKPSNIFLADDGVKIVDFGIVKLVGEAGLTTTNPHGPIGTPSFLAPEQLRGEEPDARTDLHALGVCMYAMLTGKSPWKARAPTEVVAEILRDDPRPVRELRAAIPPALEEIVRRALVKDRAERFASAADMLSALESVPAIAIDASDFDPVPDTERQPHTRAVKTLPLDTPAIKPPPRTLPMPVIAPVPRRTMPLPALSLANAEVTTAPIPRTTPVPPKPRAVALHWPYAVLAVGIALTYVALDRRFGRPAPAPSSPTTTASADEAPAAPPLAYAIAMGGSAIPAPSPSASTPPPTAEAQPTASSAAASHVFRGPELEGMLASQPLDGNVIDAQDCYCLPVEVARGKMKESRALGCARCSGVPVNGSWICKGTDASGRAHEGRYLCRGLKRLGPKIPGVGARTADELY